MKRSAQLKLFLAISMLLFASLACSLLDDEGDLADDLQDTKAEQTSAPSAESTAVNAAVEPTEAATTLQKERLSSADLPTLTFGPVGPSPSTAGRVELSGSPQSLDTEHFRIHYTLSGDDAVPTADSDGNGHPDYVEEVANAVEFAWFAEIDYFGWPAPPSDSGLGGNDLFDVYLENIFEDGTAGYVDGGYDDTIIGDNPNSSTTESNASFSFMVLDNDYDEFEDFEANGVSAFDFMRSTVAHEFMHAIQYGFDSQEPHDWFWEASANWVQDEVFNDYNDLIEDAYAVFKSPDSCQLSYGGEERTEDENHWYGLWVFIRYYSERYGHQAVLELWEDTINLDGYDVWRNALSERGSSLEEFFRDFSVALLLREFEEGADYPAVRLEGEASLGAIFEPQDGVGQLGADYLRIDTTGSLTIHLDSDGLSGLAVALDANQQAHLFPLVDGEVGLNAANYEYLFLIVLNQILASNEDGCQSTTYAVEVQSGADASDPSSSLSAPNFEPPQVESLGAGSFEGGEGGEAPEDLALVYIPAGYDFYSSYEQEREDFYDPDNVDYYIPGDGPATVLDYFGADDSLFISLYESHSPHASLDDFLDDVAYDPLPGELQSIEGFEVLIEDFSDGDDLYSVATFIIDDYFYVIEGTIDPEEMADVVAAWITG